MQVAQERSSSELHAVCLEGAADCLPNVVVCFAQHCSVIWASCWAALLTVALGSSPFPLCPYLDLMCKAVTLTCLF